MFRALRHRNFRIFFYGQTISLTGTWIQQIALSWMVYRMTGSAFLLGLVAFSSQIATFFLAPFAGVIADRHHRHRLLLLTQAAAMVQAFILTALVLTHSIVVWHIIALSFLMGLINAFDLPVRQAFIVDMINEREDLGNAIALNSSMVNAARLIGPSIGGFLIAVTGEGLCFFLNALSYVAVIVSLLIMKIPRKEKSTVHQPMWRRLKEGFQYTFSFMPIRTIIVLLGVASFVGGGSQALMPVFARDVFHGGSQTLGFLMASTGLGALLGAIFLASRKTVLGLAKIISGACFLFGAALIGFALIPSLWFSLPLLLLSGFGMMVHMAASNMVLQSMVEEDKRGRVMSFYTMSLIGMSSFGCLIAGSMAHRFGAASVLVVGGGCVLVAGILFAVSLPRLRAQIRPVYMQKGIISDIVH